MASVIMMEGRTMRRTTTVLTVMMALAVPAILTGCGDGNENVFENCPDGVLDPGEQCDDGNTSDNDNCLTTCVRNVCNDQFLNTGVEVCDGSNLDGNSCGSLGLGLGDLTCSEDCQLDTSDCANPMETPVGTPIPQPTPTDANPDPTATPDGPSGPTCAAGDMIRVAVELDTGGVSMAGATVRLDYPTDLVDIPGSIDAPTVQDSVTFLVAAPFTVVNDQDTDPADGIDDRLNLSATGITPFAPGPFAHVDFDCFAGATAPTVGDFVCVAVGSDEFGGELSTVCRLAIP